MKCPRCGNELKDGMLFCEHCGEEIRIVQDFEPEMEMNMETFSTETFSVEEDFPMDEILSDRMEFRAAQGCRRFHEGSRDRTFPERKNPAYKKAFSVFVCTAENCYGNHPSAAGLWGRRLCGGGGQAFQRRLSV